MTFETQNYGYMFVIHVTQEKGKYGIGVSLKNLSKGSLVIVPV